MDPWRALSVSGGYDAKAKSPALTIDGAAHCSDLGSTSSDDPTSLTGARQKIATFFRDIIQAAPPSTLRHQEQDMILIEEEKSPVPRQGQDSQDDQMDEESEVQLHFDF